jgi:hypothetical protein
VHGPFEQGQGSGHVPLAEAQQTEAPQRNEETGAVLGCLCDPEPCFADVSPGREPAQLRMAHREAGTRIHGWQVDLPVAFMAACSIECRCGLREGLASSTIVPLGLEDMADGLVRLRVQDSIVYSSCEREGTLGCRQGLLIGTSDRERGSQEDGNLA